MASAADEERGDPHPTRSEVAEYVHDMAGQLADMAQDFGLLAAAEALKRAQSTIEGEY